MDEVTKLREARDGMRIKRAKLQVGPRLKLLYWCLPCVLLRGETLFLNVNGVAHHNFAGILPSTGFLLQIGTPVHLLMQAWCNPHPIQGALVNEEQAMAEARSQLGAPQYTDIEARCGAALP